ncbi:MAG TPA: DUF1259 domain-containing protein [Tepidisphaeraceae bacterium]|jgi:hypothetical protein
MKDKRSIAREFLLALMVGGCTATRPPHQPQQLSEAPATGPASAPSDLFKDVAAAMKLPGVQKGEAYVITIPRDDLLLMNFDGEIPTDAGVESVFYFYRCPCGKMNVAGTFCVLEAEANDVIDALRAGGAGSIKIASLSPMFVGERPRVLALRFGGSGTVENLTKTLKEALSWTGEERTPTQPAK